MKPYRIDRNKNMDFFILAVSIFLLAGGLYFLIDGRSDQQALGWLLALVPSCVIVFITYKLIQNKPYIIFSTEGVYLKTLNRTIPWSDVSSMEIISKEIEENLEKDVPDIKTVYYFKVFEITERSPHGNYGHDRNTRIDFTNHNPETIQKVATQYLSYYKSS